MLGVFCIIKFVMPNKVNFNFNISCRHMSPTITLHTFNKAMSICVKGFGVVANRANCLNMEARRTRPRENK